MDKAKQSKHFVLTKLCFVYEDKELNLRFVLVIDATLKALAKFDFELRLALYFICLSLKYL